MQKLITPFILCFLFSTCQEKRYIHYQYNEITVTRVDYGKITKLYYGNFNDLNKDVKPSVIVEGNHDNSTSGFLIFRKHRVDVINNGGGAYHNTSDKNEYLKVLDIDNYQYDTILSSENFNKGNILLFHEIVNIEREFNSKRKCAVEVIYPIN